MLLETDIILRLVAAAFLGALVGFERELHHKPAGLRTHALVCMGSCLFVVLSVAVAGDGGDVTRLAAGVVTGIGFLGAGTIFMAQDKLHGLTTAAEMWALAGVGAAVGFGYFTAAAAGVFLIFLLLVPGKLLEKKAIRKR